MPRYWCFGEDRNHTQVDHSTATRQVPSMFDKVFFETAAQVRTVVLRALFDKPASHEDVFGGAGKARDKPVCTIPYFPVCPPTPAPPPCLPSVAACSVSSDLCHGHHRRKMPLFPYLDPKVHRIKRPMASPLFATFPHCTVARRLLASIHRCNSHRPCRRRIRHRRCRQAALGGTDRKIIEHKQAGSAAPAQDPLTVRREEADRIPGEEQVP